LANKTKSTEVFEFNEDFWNIWLRNS
jgi:hypothetical protein